jgi:hypothetical protein
MKTKGFKPFRINTYAKTGGGGIAAGFRIINLFE